MALHLLTPVADESDDGCCCYRERSLKTKQPRRSSRRGVTSNRFARLRLGVLVLVQVALVWSVFPVAAAWAVSDTFYLKGDGVPKASLSLSFPTARSLPNFDPGRDSFPGLLLAKSSQGVNESDSTKYQLWVGY